MPNLDDIFATAFEIVEGGDVDVRSSAPMYKPIECTNATQQAQHLPAPSVSMYKPSDCTNVTPPCVVNAPAKKRTRISKNSQNGAKRGRGAKDENRSNTVQLAPNPNPNPNIAKMMNKPDGENETFEEIEEIEDVMRWMDEHAASLEAEQYQQDVSHEQTPNHSAGTTSYGETVNVQMATLGAQQRQHHVSRETAPAQMQNQHLPQNQLPQNQLHRQHQQHQQQHQQLHCQNQSHKQDYPQAMSSERKIPPLSMRRANVVDLSAERKFNNTAYHIGRQLYVQHIVKNVLVEGGTPYNYDCIRICKRGPNEANYWFDIPTSLYETMMLGLNKMIMQHPGA